MAVTHTQDQGQRSVLSKVEWKQMDGQTDGGDCFTFRANAVGKNSMRL